MGRPQPGRHRLRDDHDGRARALEGEQPRDVRRPRRRRLDRRRARPARGAALAREGGRRSRSRAAKAVDECAQASFYRDEVLDFWREQPGEKARLAAQAVGMLWSPFLSVAADDPAQQGLADLLQRTVEPAFVLAALRARALGRVPRTAPFRRAGGSRCSGFNTLMAMVFAGTVRYRAPWDFLLALLAAFALERAWALLREPARAGRLERRPVERLDPLGAALLRELLERARPPGSGHRGGARGVAGELANRTRRAPRRRPAGTNSPVRPSSTISGRPPTALAITGRPRSIASSATIPKPSPSDGTTTTSARSKTGAAGATRPRNDTTSSSPSRARGRPELLLERPVARDLERQARKVAPHGCHGAEEDVVALDRDQPADDREPRSRRATAAAAGPGSMP